MKCLSVWQPWADLIVHGRKDVENRTWETPYRGALLIHAGLVFDREHGLDRDERRMPEADRPIIEAARERTGIIVGMVRLADCVTDHPSPWFVGPFGFVLEKAVMFRHPTPWAVGKRLFDVPDEAVRSAPLADG